MRRLMAVRWRACLQSFQRPRAVLQRGVAGQRAAAGGWRWRVA